MPRVVKKGKSKGDVLPPEEREASPSAERPSTTAAVAEPTPSDELRPPTAPIEPAEGHRPEGKQQNKRRDRPVQPAPAGPPAAAPKRDEAAPEDKDRVASSTSLNIAKLQ